MREPIVGSFEQLSVEAALGIIESRGEYSVYLPSDLEIGIRLARLDIAVEIAELSREHQIDKMNLGPHIFGNVFVWVEVPRIVVKFLAFFVQAMIDPRVDEIWILDLAGLSRFGRFDLQMIPIVETSV